MNLNLERCLLGILQRGITEARFLSLTGENRKAADLLDALDNIPKHLANWNDELSESEIETQLSCYMKLNPNSVTNYLLIYNSRHDLL